MGKNDRRDGCRPPAPDRDVPPRTGGVVCSPRLVSRNKGVAVNKKILICAGAVIAAFLIGFVPAGIRASRVQDRLRQCEATLKGAELRGLAGLAYVQAAQKNYGLAQNSAGQLFDRIREIAPSIENAGQRRQLEELLARRDAIISSLAKADPAVLSQLEDLYLRTWAATTAVQK